MQLASPSKCGASVVSLQRSCHVTTPRCCWMTAIWLAACVTLRVLRCDLSLRTQGTRYLQHMCCNTCCFCWLARSPVYHHNAAKSKARYSTHTQTCEQAHGPNRTYIPNNKCTQTNIDHNGIIDVSYLRRSTPHSLQLPNWLATHS